MLAPKSHKNFIEPSAEEAKVTKAFMEDLVGFYYGELRKNMVEMKNNILVVPNLGNFEIKPHSLNQLKAKLMKNLNVLENPETFAQMSIKKDLEQNLENVNKVQNLIIDESKRRKEIKEKRRKNSARNLQESKSNT